MVLEPEPGEGSSRSGFAGRAAARIVVPGLLVLAGLVLIILGHGALGGTLIGIALVVVVVDVFARLTLRSQGDRDREDAAREKFDRSGEW